MYKMYKNKRNFRYMYKKTGILHVILKNDTHG